MFLDVGPVRLDPVGLVKVKVRSVISFQERRFVFQRESNAIEIVTDLIGGGQRKIDAYRRSGEHNRCISPPGLILVRPHSTVR